MSSKRKLIVSILVVAFVLLSFIATIAVVFALTQQTIETSLNINYTVEDIDGTASASFTIGGVTEKLTAMKGENVIGDTLVFKAEDTEDVGNLVFPEDGLALTSQNDNVVIQYTYSNNGDKHYIASMSFEGAMYADNMKVEYSIDGTNYSEQRYAVVVPANTSNRSYWIRISIINVALDASFEGNFNWMLEGCDPQSEDYKTLTEVEFEAVEGQTGAYSVTLAGTGSYIAGERVVFPSQVGEDTVTTIAASSLTAEEKNMVKSVYIPESVTKVGDNAFEGFVNLETVNLQQNSSASGASAQSDNTGLTTIGVNSFKDCSSLTNFIVPNTVTSCDKTAFTNCINLKNLTINTMDSSVLTATKTLANANGELNLTIGNSVTSIGDYAFDGCTGLTSITISDSITNIGKYVFRNCTGLTGIVIPFSVTSIGVSIFYNCTGLGNIEIPNSVTNINTSTFYNCISLTSIEIPNSVTKIGENAFRGCKGLTSIVIPDAVTSIGTSAFYDCTSLTSIVIPNSVTNIGGDAFSGCTGLTSVIVGSGVTKLGNGPFCNCTGLENIIVDSNNTKYYSEGNCIIEKSTKTLVLGCKTSIIPNYVTSIGNYAFTGCTGLTNIEIPDSVTSIGSHAFEECTGFTSVTIGSVVTSIGVRAFRNCKGLTSIVIPNSVTTINTEAFIGCKGLTSVTIGSGVTSVNNSAFNSTGLENITVNSNNKKYYSEGNCLIEKSSKKLIFGCKTSVIPNDVTSIENRAFWGCTGLTDIVIPDSVTSIGAYAFSGCTGIKSVTFENTEGWFIASSSTATSGTSVDVTSANTNLINWLTKTSGYYDKYWKRK